MPFRATATHSISNDHPESVCEATGEGLSSAPVNMVWALVNVEIGYVLLRAGHVGSGMPALAVFFAGVAVIGLCLSLEFQKKQAR
jgi:hypothetical protein